MLCTDPGQKIDLNYVREFMERHRAVLEGMRDYDIADEIRLIVDTPVLEYHDECDYLGWNFQGYPVFVLFQHHQYQKYIAAIVHTDGADGCLDKMPVYILDLTDENMVPRLIGNVREYMKQLVCCFVEVLKEDDNEDAVENLLPARVFMQDLYHFSNELISLQSDLTRESFKDGVLLK
jgi:hypothetical protein